MWGRRGAHLTSTRGEAHAQLTIAADVHLLAFHCIIHKPRHASRAIGAQRDGEGDGEGRREGEGGRGINPRSYFTADFTRVPNGIRCIYLPIRIHPQFIYMKYI